MKVKNQHQQEENQDKVQKLIDDHESKLDELKAEFSTEKNKQQHILPSKILEHEEKIQSLTEEANKQKANMISSHREQLMAAHQKHMDTQEEYDRMSTLNEKKISELTLENSQVRKLLSSIMIFLVFFIIVFFYKRLPMN